MLRLTAAFMHSATAHLVLDAAMLWLSEASSRYYELRRDNREAVVGHITYKAMICVINPSFLWNL